MAKSADAFRTISEVAEWLETPAHVLRFWESKFSQVKPVKRAGGRRYYRPTDMQLLGGIKRLLHEDGMTIKGVQKILRENGVKHVASLSQPLDEVTEIEASQMAVDIAPDDEPPTSADVVSFRGGEGSASDSGQHPDGIAQVPPRPTKPEPTRESAPETEDDQVSKPEPEPEEGPVFASDSNTRDGAPDDSTAPVMPSFLQRQKEAEPTPEPETASLGTDQTPDPEPDPEPEAEPARLVAPDIPDDPPDDAPAEPGPLSALGHLSANVDPGALSRMQELADQLGSGSG